MKRGHSLSDEQPNSSAFHLSRQTFVTTAQSFAPMQLIADLSGDPALGIRVVHPPSSLAAFYVQDLREVRELAQRSAKAAKEIKALIVASGTQVKTGVSLVEQTGGPLRRSFQRCSK